jgi:hypothetical protein
MELGGGSQPLIARGEQSGSLTHIATENVSLWRADEKLTAFLELESTISAGSGLV